MFGLWWMVTGILILTVLSIFDIRSKHIPMSGFAVVLIYSVISLVWSEHGEYDIADLLMSVIPGIMLIGLSVITEGKIGLGDGILIAELGLGLGFERCIYMVAGALIFNCVFAGAMLMSHRLGLHSRVPFIPFVAAGMGVVTIVFG